MAEQHMGCITSNMESDLPLGVRQPPVRRGPASCRRSRRPTPPSSEPVAMQALRTRAGLTQSDLAGSSSWRFRERSTTWPRRPAWTWTCSSCRRCARPGRRVPARSLVKSSSVRASRRPASRSTSMHRSTPPGMTNAAHAPPGVDGCRSCATMGRDVCAAPEPRSRHRVSAAAMEGNSSRSWLRAVSWDTSPSVLRDRGATPR